MKKREFIKRAVSLAVILLCLNNAPLPVYAEESTKKESVLQLESAAAYTENLSKEAKTFSVTIPAGQTEAEQQFNFSGQGILRIEISTDQVKQQLNQEIKTAMYFGDSPEPLIQAELLNANQYQSKIELAIPKAGNGKLKFQMESSYPTDVVIQGKAAFYNGKDRTLSSKKWIVSGAVSETDVIYYKIKIPKTGYIVVEEEPYYMEDKIEVSLKNSEKTSKYSNEVLLSEKNNWTSYYAVKKGTYYLKVSGTKKPYLFCYTFTEAADQSGVNKGKATAITTGKSKSGLVFATDPKTKTDWFKVTLSKKQKLRLTINSKVNAPLTYQIIPENANIKLHNSKFYPPNGIARVTTAEYLPKGTYYIRIAKKSAVDTSGFYSIKLEK